MDILVIVTGLMCLCVGAAIGWVVGFLGAMARHGDEGQGFNANWLDQQTRIVQLEDELERTKQAKGAADELADADLLVREAPSVQAFDRLNRARDAYRAAMVR